MESQPTEERESRDDQGEGTPVCLGCFRPVDPLAHYCAHCGEASGTFTTYLPYECIPWETRIWGQMWRQVWSHDVSFPGRLFRFLFLAWFCPFILIGLIPKFWYAVKKCQHAIETTLSGAHDLCVNRRDILKKRVITSVIVFIGLAAAFLVWQGRTIISTHHASITVRIDPHGIHGAEYTQQRRTQVEQVIPNLTSILKEAGLVAMTDPNAPFNTTTSGNNQDDRVLKFKGQTTGKGNTIPLEALIVIDAAEFEQISITLSEGYSQEPSERLAELYGKLDQALDSIEGDKYVSKLW